MAVVLLDTGAVVGFLDRADPFNASADRMVRDVAGERLILSAVSYAELLVGARLGHHVEDAVRGFCSELVSEIVPVDRVIAEKGAELRAQHRWLGLPDALALATAELDPAERVIGTDASWSKVRGLRTRFVRLVAG